MAYKKELYLDIPTKKEFKELIDIKDAKNRSRNKHFFESSNILRLTPTQLFGSRYLNPYTAPSRLILKKGTGTGKTLGALYIALQYGRIIKEKMLNGEKNQPKIIVLGFTKEIFKNEILKFPELGFITYQEREELIY